MHILWDWNGTLLDDTHACVETLNIMLERRGKEPVTYEFFRENFSFPARDFYRMLGMDVPDSEWDALAEEYYSTYSTRPIAIAPGAIEALEYVKSLGIPQSVFSALREDHLRRQTEFFGIAPYMTYISGSDNLDGGSKLAHGRELVAKLRGERGGGRTTSGLQQERTARGGIVLIGDSLHDKEVADALGIGCVFYSGGSHSASRLRSRAPVADSLLACARLAGA